MTSPKASDAIQALSPPAASTRATTSYPTVGWLRKLRARYIFLSSGSRRRLRGKGHSLHYGDSLLYHCTIEMMGHGNTVEILPGARLWDVTIRLIGDNLHCRIGGQSRLHGGQYILEDKNSRLSIGEGCTIYSPMCVVNEGGAIQVGNDCMIAYGTDLRNSDGHSILDGITRQRINVPRNITVHDHVWIGAQCQVLKGVTIGSRAIVAARSVVTKDVAAGTLVAGVPTRVIRENVDWDSRRL